MSVEGRGEVSYEKGIYRDVQQEYTKLRNGHEFRSCVRPFSHNNVRFRLMLSHELQVKPLI